MSDNIKDKCKPLLEVRDLRGGVEGKEILKGINLTVMPGEVHAIMGPNGSGKSTLSATLAGDPRYQVYGGEAYLNGKDLLALSPEDRSHEGLFLSFQYPVEIPGVSMVNFMRAAINAKRKYFGEAPLSAGEFLKMMRKKREIVELDNKLASRSILITHYQRLLDYIKPDFVHILYKGRIVYSGGPELALELEEKGYDWIKEKVDAEL